MQIVNILGIKVNRISYEELYKQVLSYVKGATHKIIFTPNPEIIYKAKDDAQFCDLLNQADIGLPDGIGVLVASRISGDRISQRITGIDAFTFLCEKMVGKIYLLGSKPGIAKKAKAQLEKSYPGIEIVGFNDGYFSDDQSDHIIDLINQSRAEILFVGLGSPRQENWLIQNRDKLNVKVSMVIGGSMDVVSGTIKRSPELMIKLNIEWLYRLIQEPWRYKRMLVLPKFIFSVILDRLSKIQWQRNIGS